MSFEKTRKKAVGRYGEETIKAIDDFVKSAGRLFEALSCAGGRKDKVATLGLFTVVVSSLLNDFSKFAFQGDDDEGSEEHGND